MPAHNMEYCGLLNARWGGGVRPAPVCPSAYGGVLVSASCYHGYERLRQTQSSSPANDLMDLDCEMSAVPPQPTYSPPANTRKRSGDEQEASRVKRLRQEVLKENLPVEKEKNRRKRKTEEESLERLLWSTHGASMFHLLSDTLQ